MDGILSCKAWVFGNNVDTDQIYPGRYLELTEPSDISRHAMEGVDRDFAGSFETGGVIVAGDNFGCGSSREHAVIALKYSGVSAIVANSFGRIFYRNAINLGLPVINCPGISPGIKPGDTLSIDLKKGTILSLETNRMFQGDKLSGHVLTILEAGGIIPLFRRKHLA